MYLIHDTYTRMKAGVTSITKCKELGHRLLGARDSKLDAIDPANRAGQTATRALGADFKDN